MIRWPWVSMQSLNLDWILARMKELIENVNAFAGHVTATFNAGYPGAVNVTGDLESSLNFDFTIPPGPQGPEGPQGPTGTALKILGLVASVPDLPADPAIGDVWLVGNSFSNTARLWDGSTWKNIGSIQSVQRTAAQMTIDTVSEAAYNFTVNYAYVIKNGDGSINCFASVTTHTGHPNHIHIADFPWTAGIAYDVDLDDNCTKAMYATYSSDPVTVNVGVTEADGIKLYLGGSGYPPLQNTTHRFYIHIPRGNSQME